MEDGLQKDLETLPSPDHTNNGVAPSVMANFPEGTIADTETEANQFENSNSGPKFNGSVHSSDEADNDSDVDALIIDESVPKRRVKKRKLSVKSRNSGDNCDDSEVVLHSNPYFNESLFELSQQLQAGIEAPVPDKSKAVLRVNKSKRLKKNSPKLQEYAQYLGLQPAVQFKCSKCRQSGFETLQSLNEHLVNCTADPSAFTEVEDSSVSSFKLTRKVFLCSACGTYYENWNLYMHMLEYHRRFICLYCLGMFSVLDDLCQHIQSRHNWEPHQLETPEDFFKDYKEPCFIICCDCKKLFNEQDNFFYHNCENAGSKNTPNKSVKSKCKQIRPENHVTGDSVEDNPSEINSLPIETGEPNISNPEMVRSEANPAETSEVLPAVPDFNQTGTELTSNEISDQDLQNKDSFEKSKQESDLEESFSVETKQQPSNVTADTSNDEGRIDENSFEENVNSSSDRQILDQSSRDSDMMSNDEQNSDTEETEQVDHAPNMEQEEPQETRKVPKLSLKLPKLEDYSNVEAEESEDSDKPGNEEVDQIESENEYLNTSEDKIENVPEENSIQVAGADVSIVELELETPLDKFEIKVLLQKCLLATVPICIYCNHARKIAVNGKQLGLHAIAQHRYSAIVKSITEEELIPESFVNRIKESLEDLDKVHFNLETNLTETAVTFSHAFECFQCRYSTNVHKELYLHNRKMHTKNLLLCIMCKSNFYSYSELICHLCPGDYVLDHDIQYRCCMCVSDDLPSAFRLMVHLRKRHHMCDVCLEMCHNQYKLSNHVWKHKLHHFCYRCGIAYRNKQDITRHLFWKHGTESVVCKKCLSKKWPHVFHFCIPPAVFTCEECGLNVTKAVYLKVHKRIHANEKPHSCTYEGCSETFISKKLMQKHERQHYEPEIKENGEDSKEPVEEGPGESMEVVSEDKQLEKPKPKVDVYDLPELNLSESSDSEPEVEPPKTDEVKKTEEEKIIETLEERTLEVELELANSITVSQEEQVKKPQESLESSIPILESIWDDFKIYQAKRDKIDNLFGEPEKMEVDKIEEPILEPVEPVLTLEMALQDHDYFYNPEPTQDTNVITEATPDLSQRVDHDYCTPKETPTVSELEKKEPEKGVEPKKPDNSDDSSSDSDSSSCSCGSNCSCSSDSSSNSSSDSSDSDSSTEEGRKRQQIRRENRNNNAASSTSKSEEQKEVEPAVSKPVETVENQAVTDVPILETDLDTTESETDEEFYDKQPQKFARKLLEEKRNQIMAEVGSLPNGNFYENSRNSTPSLPEEVKHKKKIKTKKRKKKKSERKEASFTEYTTPNIVETPSYQPPVVAPLTISLNTMSPRPIQTNSASSATSTPNTSLTRQETDSNLRASKRRRVPNKFYGYSSDEEADKATPTSSKWRKVEQQHRQSPLTVPPITIKTNAATTAVPKTVEPITIRQTSRSGELRVHQRQPSAPPAPPRVPPLQINTSMLPRTLAPEYPDSDSNDETAEEVEPEPPKVPVYCYCKCPYDEVSEMIGCDSHDCEIEWFHFECVGIMVPPKGQWFCPECRKKKQRREMMNC